MIARPYRATSIWPSGYRRLVQSESHATVIDAKVEFALKSPRLHICRDLLVEERQTKGSAAG
jgi:hypothetical protein